jgi:hypothetical protein
MERLAQAAVNWVERRQSRRGFLAGCGKVALAVGAAVAGFGSVATRASAACCATGFNDCSTYAPLVGTCPTTGSGGCPNGCTRVGNQTHCCDTGGSNTVHVCTVCSCGGVITCSCEDDTLVPC